MKPIGRPRTLNNPNVPEDHICGKCKEGNKTVSFKIQNGNISWWCNQCLEGLKTPHHERKRSIAAKINEYQGLK